ncbi:MAG: lysophospholipid acyltransferase family protein [Armatimonadota bacterium]|nr:lysophospholipid acyltransferase family protein [Armatimonadota bacterium]MDR7426672.1 lysophospholipid acyltransferase family protein [Armatimonadota bacterium]MDR7464379.1 lysophospholipid acyltransferase family protein [Armatimonadota bacterium]MDR7469223.1 lysophospholipid acyltransferase family protein [Armatimonadota bacterium]MDR7475066.1 lysophospholipid acyltransferase family protein [Armatimonadota bacterium]
MVPRQTLLYRLAYRTVRILLRLGFGFQVEGAARIPSGGALVVANHPSALDPVVLAAALPRRALFIGAAEFLAMPLVGWAMRAYGTIPVRRDRIDLAVVREAVRALRAGALVAIFPEGRVSPGGGSPKAGAGILAARADVPTVPAAILGTAQALPLGCYLPRRSQVRVIFGPPLPPPPPADRTAADRLVEEALGWARRAVSGALDSGVPAATVEGNRRSEHSRQ